MGLDAEDLRAELQRTIDRSGRLSVTNLAVTCENGNGRRRVKLAGRTASWYDKQLLIQAAKRLLFGPANDNSDGNYAQADSLTLDIGAVEVAEW